MSTGATRPIPALDPSSRVAGTVSLLVAPVDALGDAEARLVLETIARQEDALLICGDNRLDAYGLLARARALGLEEAMADGVLLARAFTVHQFAALLEETLPRMAEGRTTGLALVTGILEPFLDEDVRPTEARVLLARVLRTLREWATREGVRLVLSHAPPRTAEAARLAALVEDAAVERVEAPRAGGGARTQTTVDGFGSAHGYGQVDPGGPMWAQVDPRGPKWIHVAPPGHRWVHVAAPRGGRA